MEILDQLNKKRRRRTGIRPTSYKARKPKNNLLNLVDIKNSQGEEVNTVKGGSSDRQVSLFDIEGSKESARANKNDSNRLNSSETAYL